MENENAINENETSGDGDNQQTETSEKLTPVRDERREACRKHQIREERAEDVQEEMERLQKEGVFPSEAKRRAQEWSRKKCPENRMLNALENR
ncbi:hypothetical protein [Gluconobacter cerinus]|uniref:hypothetical protein n=1 Tax=Gluconobacter cerinus TaxID=38307 RepID=UPI001B8C23EB|nr:hypothetical protein [Gluconobacter cerinus]MBS1035387.1 hypothetical protein [Gluconobacter cerinus]